MFDFVFAIFPVLFTIGFLFIAGMFIYAIWSSISQNRRNNQSPVLTVPVVISGKRMELSPSADHTEMGNSRSVYYVTFQFESGDRQEFSVPSSEYGMLAEGDCGKLTFQGTRYLRFDRMR